MGKLGIALGPALLGDPRTFLLSSLLVGYAGRGAKQLPIFIIKVEPFARVFDLCRGQLLPLKGEGDKKRNLQRLTVENLHYYKKF